MKRSTSCILGLAAALACAGCDSTTRYARQPDVVVPANEIRVVTFAPLVQQRVISNSFYSRTKEPGVMDRVLLGPNLVFEASRSSLEEPDVWPPGGPGSAGGANAKEKADIAGRLRDALGYPVEFPNSAILMQYLSSERSSKVLAPVVTRRFSHEWCWPNCPKTTWMERLMLLYQRPSSTTSKEGGKESTVTWAGRELKPDELPTIALAVRSMGISGARVPVTVALNDKGEVEFRPRVDAAEPSLCQADMTMAVPMINFQAELVSMKDGQVLARIDEERSPTIALDPRRKVVAAKNTPITEQAFTEYQDGKPYAGQYTYVKSYTRQEVLCANALAAFREVSGDLYRKLQSGAKPALLELLRTTLDPLYSK